MKAALLIALPVLALVSCKSKELTRSKAAELISKQFPQPLSGEILVGKDYVDSKSLEDYLKAPYGKLAKLEQDDGVISVSWLGMQQPNVYAIDVELTDRGKSFVTPGSYRTLRGYAMKVRMCDQQFVDVTGITLPEPTIAEVAFTWKIGNFSPFGKRYQDVNGKPPVVCSDVAGNGMITMRLFDDGWRIAQ